MDGEADGGRDKVFFFDPDIRLAGILPAVQSGGILAGAGDLNCGGLGNGLVRGEAVDLHGVAVQHLSAVDPQASPEDPQSAGVGAGHAVEEGVRIAVEGEGSLRAPGLVGGLSEEGVPAGVDSGYGGRTGAADGAGLQGVVVDGELRRFIEHGGRKGGGIGVGQSPEFCGRRGQDGVLHFSGMTLRVLVNHPVFPGFQRGERLGRIRQLKEVRPEGIELHVNGRVGGEVPKDLFRGVAPDEPHRAHPVHAAFPQIQGDGPAFPCVVAGDHEAVAARSAADGAGTVGLRQGESVHKQGSGGAVEIEDPGQGGVFVVPQEPRIAVDFRGQDHAPPESLIDQIVREVVQGGGEADPVVLRQPLKSLLRDGKAPVEEEAAVVHARVIVGGMDVHIGFRPLPEEGGDVALGGIQVQPVVQDDEVRGILPALPEHPPEDVGLFLPERAADAVQLEEGEAVFPAEIHHEAVPALLLLGGVAEAVRGTPEPQPDAGFRRLLRDGTVAAGILGAELFAFRISVALGRSVEIAGVPGVDSDLHAVFPLQPGEEVEVQHGLPFRGALVGVVDPGEILGYRRGAAVGSRFGRDFLGHGCLLFWCLQNDSALFYHPGGLPSRARRGSRG